MLLDGGVKVRAVTRDPASAVLPEGAEIVAGDPSHPQTLEAALRGVEAIFLVPRALGDATAELLQLAAAQGVERAALVSATTVQFGGGYERFADGFRAVEDAVKASGLRWTILRCADFAANAMVWAPQIRSGGVVRGAYGDATTSPIHERDVAAVAVRALANGGHAGHSYVLTGPQPLNQRDRVRVIGEAIGREVSWVEVSPEQIRRAMTAQGLPDEVPDRLLGYLADHVERPGPSSADVERVLGRPALTFAEWATGHATAFKS
jgi:uncharacterized protein YbjT (DUF2867 family)